MLFRKAGDGPISGVVEGRWILAQVCVRGGYLPGEGTMLRTFPLILSLPQNWLTDWRQRFLALHGRRDV